MDVITQHQVVPIGADLMELRDNGDGSVIARATRTSATDNWTIVLTRDETISLTASSRPDAYMAMINNGPAGVAEGHNGYSTLVPHGLGALA